MTVGILIISILTIYLLTVSTAILSITFSLESLNWITFSIAALSIMTVKVITFTIMTIIIEAFSIAVNLLCRVPQLSLLRSVVKMIAVMLNVARLNKQVYSVLGFLGTLMITLISVDQVLKSIKNTHSDPWFWKVRIKVLFYNDTKKIIFFFKQQTTVYSENSLYLLVRSVLLFILKILFTFDIKQATLTRRSIVPSLPLQFVFPGIFKLPWICFEEINWRHDIQPNKNRQNDT